MRERNSAGAGEWVDPDDAPELTNEFFNRADVHIGGRLIRRGRPPTGNAKRLVSLRIDQDVLRRLRALGPGWQTRVNDALRAFVERDEEPGGRPSPPEAWKPRRKASGRL